MGDIRFETIVGGPIGTNCYVVYNEDTKEGIIIDPGIEMSRLTAGLDKLGVKPVGIFLTHAHADHIMCCNEAASFYRVDIYMHEEEKQLAKDAYMNCSADMFGNPNTVIANVYLKDKQKLDIIDTTMEVIHTPGHTSGGCCYYFSESGYLFCGDTLFMQGVGRSDLPTGNSMKLINSLKERLFILPEDVKAFPGHGPATRIGYEKINNPYADGFY